MMTLLDVSVANNLFTLVAQNSCDTLKSFG